MRAYIKKLQSKSEDTRKQILVGSLIILMSFVCFIWVSSLGNKFSTKNTAKVEEDLKPFALFGQSISDTYNNITASVGNVSSSFKKDETKVSPTAEESAKTETQKQIDLIPVEYQ